MSDLGTDDLITGWSASIAHLKCRTEYRSKLAIVWQWLGSTGIEPKLAGQELLEDFENTLSNDERRVTRRALRSFFGYLRREGHRTDDPTEAMADLKTRPPARPRELSEEEVASFLSRLSEAAEGATARNAQVFLTRTSAMCELAYSSGFGLKSLCSVKNSDFAPGTAPSIVIVANDGTRRCIPITQVAAAAVSRWLRCWASKSGRNGLYLFHGHDLDRPLSGGGRSPAMHRSAITGAGLAPITPGLLKHAFIMHMLRRGFDEQWLAYILGLTSLQVLQDRFEAAQKKRG